ncbi:unnamed protein product, partial [Porites evermanni]
MDVRRQVLILTAEKLIKKFEAGAIEDRWNVLCYMNEQFDFDKI